MHRSSFKMRKSLGRAQKQNVPEILNNVEKEGSLSTLPTIHFPCNTLNLRQDPLKKSKKLPVLDVHKSRTSKSTQHLSSVIRLIPSMAPVKAPPPPPPSPYEINQLENINLIRQYSVDQLKYLLSNDKCVRFLQPHSVKGPMRAKMVDWMIEVLSSYKCTDKTFFQAVTLMDHYYTHSLNTQQVKNLHLIGVCCMFMIIKLQQIIPIRLRTVYEKIAHRKISMDIIKNKEQEILSVAGFNILIPNLYDTITTTIAIWNSQAKLANKVVQQLIDFTLHMGKMVIIDYDTISEHSKASLTGALIHLGFKLFKQSHVGFIIDDNIQKIREILQIQKDELDECSDKLQNFVKNFETYYPSLGNLKKFSKLDFQNKVNHL